MTRLDFSTPLYYVVHGRQIEGSVRPFLKRRAEYYLGSDRQLDAPAFMTFEGDLSGIEVNVASAVQKIREQVVEMKGTSPTYEVLEALAEKVVGMWPDINKQTYKAGRSRHLQSTAHPDFLAALEEDMVYSVRGEGSPLVVTIEIDNKRIKERFAHLKPNGKDGYLPKTTQKDRRTNRKSVW